MNETERTQLIDEIVKASRKPLPQIRPVYEIEGVDGKWYSPFGLPWQFEGTDRRRVAGYAFADRNGTTYGLRGASEQELVDRFRTAQDRQAAEFRAELEKMSAGRLSEQAAYWLRSAA